MTMFSEFSRFARIMGKDYTEVTAEILDVIAKHNVPIIAVEDLLTFVKMNVYRLSSLPERDHLSELTERFVKENRSCDSSAKSVKNE